MATPPPRVVPTHSDLEAPCISDDESSSFSVQWADETISTTTPATGHDFDLHWPVYHGWSRLSALFGACTGLGRGCAVTFPLRVWLWWYRTKSIAEEFAENDSNWIRCPILSRAGEPLIPWDEAQIYIWMVTKGAYILERHGTITLDNYLLINHRLVPVPRIVRSCIPDQDRFFVTTYFTSMLYSLNRHIMKDDPPVADPHVVIFQHGLLESGLSFLLAAQDDDSSPPWVTAIMHILLLPFGILWYFIMNLVHIFPSYGDGSVSASERLRFDRSLALRALQRADDNNSTHVWLTNTRGNSFTTNLIRNIQCPNGRERITAFPEIFKEQWNHHDIALLDVEATLATIRAASSPHAEPFAPHVVAFSQGCAIYILNQAIKYEIRLQRKNEGRPPARSQIYLKGLTLINPPLKLRPLDNFEKSESLTASILCRVGWNELGRASQVINIVMGIIHPRLHWLVGLIVKHAMCFNSVSLPYSAAQSAFSLIPSGVTSKGNMLLWKSRIDNGLCLGERLDFSLNESLFIIKQLGGTEWGSRNIPVMGHIFNVCPFTMYCSLLDSIVDSRRSIEAVLTQCPPINVKMLEGQQAIRLSNCGCRSEIILLPKMNHVDLVWNGVDARGVHADITRRIIQTRFLLNKTM